VDGEAELRRLREQLAILKDEARANEQIHRRAHQRHLRLLQAASLGELLRAMIEGLRAAYALDAVTLVIRDLNHEIRQLYTAENPHQPPPAGVIFAESLQGLARQYNTLNGPWLGPFIGSDHGLIFPGDTDLGSCALLPLRRHEDLIGCLNLGSRDAARFTRHHATDFLQQLGDIAAVCLENAVNRSRLVRSGITDVLTGLYNRRYLQHRLVDELARARRDGRPLACIMLDVDHFKRVNDRWGHPAGDAVLAQTAHVVREQCRDSDVPVRYGGEEFAVLLPGADSREGMRVAERIRCEVEASPFVLPGGEELSLTVSLGVSHLDAGQVEGDLKPLGERLVAEADVQLYRAKAAGRNRACGAADRG
jgi:two-component system, cell cycle response regulator